MANKTPVAVDIAPMYDVEVATKTGNTIDLRARLLRCISSVFLFRAFDRVKFRVFALPRALVLPRLDAFT